MNGNTKNTLLALALAASPVPQLSAQVVDPARIVDRIMALYQGGCRRTLRGNTSGPSAASTSSAATQSGC